MPLSQSSIKPYSTPKGVVGATDASIPSGISNFKPSPINNAIQNKISGAPGSPQVAAVQQTSDYSKYFGAPVQSAPASQSVQNAPTPPQSALSSAVGGLQGIGQGSGSGNPAPYQSYLMGQATGQNASSGSIAGLQGIAQNQTKAVTDAQKDYNTFAQQNPYMLAAQSNPNVAADVASGRSSLLGQTFAAESQAKQQAVTNALAGQGQQITAGQAAGNLGLTGQQQQIGAAENAGNLGLTNQGQQASAFGAAGTLASPQGYSPTTTPFNPVEQTFTGGSNAQFNRAINGANMTSAQDFASNINNIESKAPAASANFKQLINAVSQFPSNVPIVSGISQLFGNTIQANQYVAQFQSQIASIKSAYKELTGAEPDISMNSTPQQLTQILNTLDASVQNTLTGQKRQLNQLSGNQGQQTQQSSSSNKWEF